MAAAVLQLAAVHPEMGGRFPWPAQMSAQAAGMDLVAALDLPVVLLAGARALVPCGFAMALPAGFEAQIRPRSGLALKHGVTCLNAPGTIDADYRGEVQVLLVNHGSEAFTVAPGARIAQMVVAAVAAVRVEVVAELAGSPRGSGGFGSTGA